MKRFLRRFLALSLAAALLVALACVPAMASGSKKRDGLRKNDEEESLPFSLGQWYTASPRSWEPMYKLTLKKDCVLELNWKNSGTTTDKQLVMNFSTPDQYVYIQVGSYDGTGKYLASGTKKFAFEAGTYFFNIYQSEGLAQVRLKTSAIVNKENYRRGKAVSLKKNSTVKIVQTPMNNYSRWYKITLTKAAKVRLYLNAGINYGYRDYLSLFDSNMKQYEVNSGLEAKVGSTYNSVVYTTTGKLKKGVYYIFVPGNAEGLHGRFGAGTYQTLKWN